MNPLLEWQSFYVLVGSAAGALIGLQFMLMALIAEVRKRADGQDRACGHDRQRCGDGIIVRANSPFCLHLIPKLADRIEIEAFSSPSYSQRTGSPSAAPRA